MAPEYAMHGHFSMKSDVYSFGVIVLEIISGKRNSSFCQSDGSASSLVAHVSIQLTKFQNFELNLNYDQTCEHSSIEWLLHQAWALWRNGSPLEIVDPAIEESYQRNEVIRCIHIALLCVQKDHADRPGISTIILMLTSNTITLPVPREPGFFFKSGNNPDGSFLWSVDDASITHLEPRWRTNISILYISKSEANVTSLVTCWFCFVLLFHQKPVLHCMQHCLEFSKKLV